MKRAQRLEILEALYLFENSYEIVLTLTYPRSGSRDRDEANLRLIANDTASYIGPRYLDS